jgi:hypothetical protein
MPCMTTITLTHPSAGSGGTPLALELPATLLWSDEHSWQSVVMVTEHTTTGALNIDEWTKQAGRPMTLQGTQDRAWCSRETLATLRAWANTAGLLLTANHRGTTYTVKLDNSNGPAITAEPLAELLQGPGRYTVRNEAGALVLDVDVDYFNPQPTDPFAVTVRLLIL